jgi:hypothetical protein
MSWVGLVLIVLCGFVIDGATAFPGVATLWPIAGIFLMTLGTGTDGGWTTHRWLGTRPVLFFATVAYALYLWHWPVLVFYLEYQGHSKVGFAGAIVVLAISVVLAWLTQRFIVVPFVRSRERTQSGGRLALMVSAIAIAALIAAGGTAKLEAERDAALALAGTSSQHPGALAMTGLVPDDDEWTESFIPVVHAASQDKPAVQDAGCVQRARGAGTDEVLVCPPYGAESPDKTIVLSGGSKVVQWYPALQVLADEENWRLIVIDKNECRLADPGIDDSILGPTCSAWNRDAFDEIVDLQPDAVFTISTKSAVADGAETYLPEAGARWRQLSDAGVPVIAVRDTPRFGDQVPDCVAAHADDPPACGQSRSQTFAATSPAEGYLAGGDVALIDLTDSICSESSCEPVVGNVLAYRDWHHFTATFARTLAPALRASLTESAPWMFTDQ